MKFVTIFIIASLGAASADVSHLVATSVSAGSSSRFTPPIPNALRSSPPISKLISHGNIGIAAQAKSASFLPKPPPTPDSATQGPNPQDIATPEPEYIDIDLPFPDPSPPKPPAPQQSRKLAPRITSVSHAHAHVSAPRIPVGPPAPRFSQFHPPSPGSISHSQRSGFSTAPNFGHASSQNYFKSRSQIPAHTLQTDGYHYNTPRRHYHKK